MALPKHHRLRQRRDFSAVYQSGLRRSTAHLTLRGLRQSNLPAKAASKAAIAAESAPSIESQPTQFGISISQKVSKRAVIRNRIRRQIQAALHQLLPQVASGWRLIIVVRPGAIECDYWQFLQELEQLLVSAEVIHGHSRGDVL